MLMRKLLTQEPAIVKAAYFRVVGQFAAIYAPNERFFKETGNHERAVALYILCFTISPAYIKLLG
jgi:hypothetical protein